MNQKIPSPALNGQISLTRDLTQRARACAPGSGKFWAGLVPGARPALKTKEE